MKTQLQDMGVTFHFTCTEKEAQILNHVAGYLRAGNWAEFYSKHYSGPNAPKIDADTFDGVMMHLHGETGRVLGLVRESRAKLITDLKGAATHG
jgi:hypothetical protein